MKNQMPQRGRQQRGCGCCEPHMQQFSDICTPPRGGVVKGTPPQLRSDPSFCFLLFFNVNLASRMFTPPLPQHLSIPPNSKFLKKNCNRVAYKRWFFNNLNSNLVQFCPNLFLSWWSRLWTRFVRTGCEDREYSFAEVFCFSSSFSFFVYKKSLFFWLDFFSRSVSKI